MHSQVWRWDYKMSVTTGIWPLSQLMQKTYLKISSLHESLHWADKWFDSRFMKGSCDMFIESICVHNLFLSSFSKSFIRQLKMRVLSKLFSDWTLIRHFCSHFLNLFKSFKTFKTFKLSLLSSPLPPPVFF